MKNTDMKNRKRKGKERKPISGLEEPKNINKRLLRDKDFVLSFPPSFSLSLFFFLTESTKNTILSEGRIHTVFV